MIKLTHGSLFSGIGGFDLAAEWMGWDNKFHCEWNEFGQKVLNHYWPKAESFTDITKTDFTKYANKIDILTGGFPCQPYSSAGKRKGKEDERHLWPEMLRAIREVSPRFVVGENVRGLLNWNGGMVFEEVCAELESYGYQVAPIIIPACSVNAPHRRERIWFVAYDNSEFWGERGESKPGKQPRYRESNENSNTKINGFVAYANGSEQRDYKRADNGEAEKVWRENEGDVFREFRGDGNVTDTSSIGGLQSIKNLQPEQPGRIGPISDGSEWDVTNSDSPSTKHTIQTGRNLPTSEINNGIIIQPKGLRLQESSEVGEMERIGSKLTGKRTNWDEFPTQSPVCSGNDGLSSELDGITFPKWRNETIKAYGNAIVPQVAYQIFNAIEKTLYL